MYTGIKERVFPAWAGMNRQMIGGYDTIASVPRVGGDEPQHMEERIADYKCSPRGRG